MCFYTPTFYVRGPYYSVLFVQGKAGGVNWSIGFRRPALKKSGGCWRFPKNLDDLSRNLAPYSVSVIPRPLPTDIVEGEHYVTANILNLLPSSSSLGREPETEAAGRELVIRTQPRQPSSVSEDSGPPRWASR